MRREDQIRFLSECFGRTEENPLSNHLRRLGSILERAGFLSDPAVSIKSGHRMVDRPYSYTTIKLPAHGVQVVAMNNIAEHAFVMPITAGTVRLDNLARQIQAYLRQPHDRRGPLDAHLSFDGIEVNAIDMRDTCPMWDIKLLSSISPIREIGVKTDAELEALFSEPDTAELDETTEPVFTGPALTRKFG